MFTDEHYMREALKEARKALVLDEVQCVPDIFPALRGLIDRERRRCGRFILLGSAQPKLLRQVSESLAGRVGIGPCFGVGRHPSRTFLVQKHGPIPFLPGYYFSRITMRVSPETGSYLSRLPCGIQRSHHRDMNVL